MTHYVYIMRSARGGRLYVGVTDDVERRLEEHNRGRSRSTKPWAPWRVVHVEEHATAEAARKREWELKCTPAGGKHKRRLAETAKSRGGG